MRDPTKKELNVPKLTEQEAESIKQGLMHPKEEVRADTFVTVFGRVLPTLPKNFHVSIKERDYWKNLNAFTFEQIGGVSRYALFADENPEAFYKIMGGAFNALNQQIGVAGGNVYINTPIPKSELDDPDYIDAEATELDPDDML